MFTDFITSQIRTAVPVAIGASATYLAAHLGVVIDENTKTGVVTFVTATATGAYYLGARLLEHKFPKAGWLLGRPAAPTYTKAEKT